MGRGGPDRFARRGRKVPRRGSQTDRILRRPGDEEERGQGRPEGHPADSHGEAAGVTFATVEEIRAQFPALRRMEGTAPVAYLDGPGGTQVPQAVVDAMADYLLHHNANTHW